MKICKSYEHPQQKTQIRPFTDDYPNMLAEVAKWISDMVSLKTATFNTLLKDTVKPRLIKEHFVFDNSRSFRRVRKNPDEVEIINFQLGQRSLEGKFTVNLGVFSCVESGVISLQKALPHHCSFTAQTRIGPLLPAKVAIFKDTPVLGYFFGSPDRWWKISASPEMTRHKIEKVTALLIDYGIPWLESAKP